MMPSSPLSDITNARPAPYVPIDEDCAVIQEILDTHFPRCQGVGHASTAARSCPCRAKPPCLFRVKEVKQFLRDAAMRAPDSAEARVFSRLCSGSFIQSIKVVIEAVHGDCVLVDAKVGGRLTNRSGHRYPLGMMSVFHMKCYCKGQQFLTNTFSHQFQISSPSVSHFVSGETPHDRRRH